MALRGGMTSVSACRANRAPTFRGATVARSRSNSISGKYSDWNSARERNSLLPIGSLLGTSASLVTRTRSKVVAEKLVIELGPEVVFSLNPN